MSFFYGSITLANTDETVKSQGSLTWSKTELALMQSISLKQLQNPDLNPSNRVGNNPLAKKLGQKLFNDVNLSSSKNVACSTCHQPSLNFSDGLAKAKGIGDLNRNTPTLFGSAYQTWFYMDGRRDSLWAQAITPIEAAEEMGSTRVAAVHYVLQDLSYRSLYEEVFGKLELQLASLPKSGGPYGNRQERKQWRFLPNQLKHKINHVFANIGRAIAAYERDLMPQPGKLETFVEQLQNKATSVDDYVLTFSQQKGLKLFLDNDRTQCLQCHNGPLLTNGEFHNIGTAKLSGKHMDLGRMIGLQAVLIDEFNCYGKYSGIAPTQCDALKFVNKSDSHSPSLGAYKVPTLRGLSKTAPYGHDGKFADLIDILQHYRSPPDKSIYNHELQKLQLSDEELTQLSDFLNIL